MPDVPAEIRHLDFDPFGDRHREAAERALIARTGNLSEVYLRMRASCESFEAAMRGVVDTLARADAHLQRMGKTWKRETRRRELRAKRERRRRRQQSGHRR